MRGESHLKLGQYLCGCYLQAIPRRYIYAFLIGCIEPDRNPTTYFKGSMRFQWLRGHNYLNSRRFIRRISMRLEKRKKLGLWDYYTLGKLIHYITDAFTYPHNVSFPKDMSAHIAYEKALQKHFIAFIENNPRFSPVSTKSVMDTINHYRALYEHSQPGMHTDTLYAVETSCCVFAHFFA